jgi:(1->4)-alpha-D-glucan 1-alpha-D-glucosylmutase
MKKSTKSRAVRATYRVQLHPGFGFDRAAQVAAYLAELGVSHLYASPYLQAAKGSTHGYDIVDHGAVNAELGGREAHQRMSERLKEHGLGQVLDIVPNHMAITGAQNAWWWDVLQHGTSSRYARYFDIYWGNSSRPARVLTPILGAPYGKALRTGDLKVVRRQRHRGALLRPRQAAFAPSLEWLFSQVGVAEGDARYAEKLDVLWPTSRDPARLDQLEQQHYRLATGVSPPMSNYRCFFDISKLAALRQRTGRVRSLPRARARVAADGTLTASGSSRGWPEIPGLPREAPREPGAWIVVEKC